MILPLLVAAWLAGLMLGFRWDVPPLPLLLLALATAPLIPLLRLLRRSWWPALLVTALLLGMFRATVADPQPPALLAPDLVEREGAPPQVTLRAANDGKDTREIVLQGRITGDPEATDRRIKFVLEVTGIDLGNTRQPVPVSPGRAPGKVLVYAEPPPSLVESGRAFPFFRHGDTLTLRGDWQRPRPLEDFDYPAYLASQGISGTVWSREVEWLSEEGGLRWRGRIYDLRRRLATALGQSLPPPHSSLAQALLLGLREQLPDQVVQDFRSTGTSHLLAISGMHVGILMALALGAASFLVGRHRRAYLLLPLAAVWLYALVSGLSPSVTRAAIMGSVYLAALSLGRPRSAVPALALSAAVMTGFNPMLLFQISFQLSFAAVAGIILALPYQERLAGATAGAINPADGWALSWIRHLASWLVSALVISLAATLATLPLVAFHFQAIPVLGIPITILALPALPFVLVGSAAAALAGLAHPLLGEAIGWLAWAPLSYLLELVAWPPDGLARVLPGDWVGPPLVWGWYLTLGGLLLLSQRWGRLRQRSDGFGLPSSASAPDGVALLLLGLTAAAAVSGAALWTQLLAGHDGRLHIHFFNVGQGDSILVVTPRGRQALVDGGPGVESATRALGRALPLADRSLDLVAMTHIDADHVRGLPAALERYRVGMVLVGRVDRESPLFPQWQAALDQAGPEVLTLSAGYSLSLDQDVHLEVLNPPAPGQGRPSSDRNNDGLVLRLVHGDISVLLTADIEAEAERYLAAQGREIRSHVLKASHHGSKTSTTAGFLQRVAPAAAVISAGADNQYGHPHPEVMARLEAAVGASQVYQTALCGDIEFISDGRTLRVRTQRPSCQQPSSAGPGGG